MKTKRVGFIGLGIMGKAMATNILKAGLPLTVFDVSQEPLAEMEKLGASVAGSAREVGEESDTVFVMVRTYPQVQEAVSPPDGALGGMRRGTTLIVTSTITPQEIMAVENIAREHGIPVLDSPVSGGVLRARDASLALMVGGDGAVVQDNIALLKAVGSNVFHVGEKVGQGQAMKMVNQILVSANIVSVAEAMVVAQKLDINLQTMYDVVTRSSGTSEVLQRMGPAMIARDFSPKATMDILIKDTDIIMDTVRTLDIPLPVFSTVYQVYRMARARGLGQKDATSVLQLLEECAVLKI